MLKTYWKIDTTFFILVMILHSTPTLAMDPPPAQVSAPATCLFPTLKITQKKLGKLDTLYKNPKDALDWAWTDSDSSWCSSSSDSDYDSYSSSSDSSDYESEYLPKEAFEKEIPKMNFFYSYLTGLAGKLKSDHWAEAYNWLVSQKNDPVASYWLDNLVSEQFSQNPHKLIAWYERRAEAGDPIAYRKLGNFYRAGIRFKKNVILAKDYEKALGYYTKAGENGDPVGYRKLGEYYIWGPQKNPEIAIVYYKKAAENGDSIAYSLQSLIQHHKNSLQVLNTFKNETPEINGVSQDLKRQVLVNILKKPERKETWADEKPRLSFADFLASKFTQAYGIPEIKTREAMERKINKQDLDPLLSQYINDEVLHQVNLKIKKHQQKIELFEGILESFEERLIFNHRKKVRKFKQSYDFLSEVFD